MLGKKRVQKKNISKLMLTEEGQHGGLMLLNGASDSNQSSFTSRSNVSTYYIM